MPLRKSLLRKNALTADKADLIAKLDDTGAQLARCNAEFLKSFEEGHGECVPCLSGDGVDVKGHSFECYLTDLHSEVKIEGTGSSEHLDGV